MAAIVEVDGPALVNSLDVDARSDEHAVKNDILCGFTAGECDVRTTNLVE